MKKNILTLAIIASLASPILAQAEVKSPRMASVYGYELGGSSLPGQYTRYNTSNVLTLGVEWNANMSCGKFNPEISISNQLNGITDGFKNMMSGIIQNATGAVASLPALIIQRANPGLYDLLQQGVLQGKIDMDFAETSCEGIQEMIMGKEGLPWEQANVATKQQVWEKEIAASGGDAVKAKAEVDKVDVNNAGREWMCGQKRGGLGQLPIRTVYDVVVAGYNNYHNKTNVCDTGSPTTLQREDSDIYKYWTSADRAANWVREVVGDVEFDTCCSKVKTVSGKSLEAKHSELTGQILSGLKDVVDGSTTLTWQNLNQISAPPVVIITPSLINTIRKKAPDGRERIMEDIAGETAYARLAEQSRLAIRMLRSGQSEPIIKSFPEANEVIEKVILVMLENMALIKEAAGDVKPIASKTINRILVDEEASLQKARPTFDAPKPNNELRLDR